MTELDTLLDDALADFEEENVNPTSDTNKSSAPVRTISEECGTDKSSLKSGDGAVLSDPECSSLAPDPPLPDIREILGQVGHTDEEKYISDLTKEFDKAFTELLNSTPELRTNLSNQQDAGPGNMDADIARTMENMFRDVATAGETSAAKPPDNMEGMVPVLESLLSKLLSKEILHEPLQELLALYPEWLENNTTHPNYAVYQRQKQIVQSICDIFNGPNYESEGGKVYTLLNEMQETGPPPDEIVNRMSSEIPDAMKSGPPPPPMMGNNPEQCCIQ